MMKPDTDFSEAFTGLVFMAGPESPRLGFPPTRCVVRACAREAGSTPAWAALPGLPGVARRALRALRDPWRANCDLDPPVVVDTAESPAGRVTVMLRDQFLKAVARGAHEASEGLFLAAVDSAPGGVRASWKWRVWSMGTEPYPEPPVWVEFADGSQFKGTLFDVVVDPSWAEGQPGRGFVYLVRLSEEGPRPWTWVLFRLAPDAPPGNELRGVAARSFAAMPEALGHATGAWAPAVLRFLHPA
jgi:hypothetical protein